MVDPAPDKRRRGGDNERPTIVGSHVGRLRRPRGGFARCRQCYGETTVAARPKGAGRLVSKVAMVVISTARRRAWMKTCMPSGARCSPQLGSTFVVRPHARSYIAAYCSEAPHIYGGHIVRACAIHQPKCPTAPTHINGRIRRLVAIIRATVPRPIAAGPTAARGDCRTGNVC